jgi:hypothetical protein
MGGAPSVPRKGARRKSQGVESDGVPSGCLPLWTTGKGASAAPLERGQCGEAAPSGGGMTSELAGGLATQASSSIDVENVDPRSTEGAADTVVPTSTAMVSFGAPQDIVLPGGLCAAQSGRYGGLEDTQGGRSLSLWSLQTTISASRSMSDRNWTTPLARSWGFSRGMSSRTMGRKASLSELTIPADFVCPDSSNAPGLPARLVPMIANGLARLSLNMKDEVMTENTWLLCYSLLPVRNRDTTEGFIQWVLSARCVI